MKGRENNDVKENEKYDSVWGTQQSRNTLKQKDKISTP